MKKTTNMPAVTADVDRVLTLLRNKIRERGFTQLEVQDMLGWGRSYISQLLTKQKGLRLEQVLMILGVIEVEPSDFFCELYPGSGRKPGGWPLAAGHVGLEPRPEVSQSLAELRSLVRGLVGLLIDREVIDVDELSAAVEVSDQDCGTV